MLALSGPSRATPCVLLPAPRYLQVDGWGSLRHQRGAQGLGTKPPGSYSPVAHVDQIFVADGEELLAVRLLHLIREAIQEAVQA